jgi:hypothetical protein
MDWFKNIIDELKEISLLDFLNGGIMRTKIIRNQYLLILLIAFLAFIYVDNRYYCEQQTKRQVQLEKELQDLKYESLTISAELMRTSRQSNVEQMINERGIDVKESKVPPVIIK